MIIIKFQGGLGNQISEYAFYRRMCSVYRDTDIKADISAYQDTDKYILGFELEKLFHNIDLPVADSKEVFKCRRQLQYKINENKIVRLLKRCVNKALKFVYSLTHKHITITQKIESGYAEEKIFYELDAKKDYYLIGYWHSYNYDDLLESLRYDFEFPPLNGDNLTLANEIAAKEAVSIHIRRGDYVNSMYDVVNDEYYCRAIDLIRQKVKSPFFYIFSDDKQYVRENISKYLDTDSYAIVGGNTGEKSYIDMQLMSLCKHNIIANSTFSYWAAQLNPNPDKLVVRPKMQTSSRQTWPVKGWYII